MSSDVPLSLRDTRDLHVSRLLLAIMAIVLFLAAFTGWRAKGEEVWIGLYLIHPAAWSPPILVGMGVAIIAAIILMGTNSPVPGTQQVGQ